MRVTGKRADDLHRAEYFPRAISRSVVRRVGAAGVSGRWLHVCGFYSGGDEGRGEKKRERERKKSVTETTAVAGNILAGIPAATFISNCVST